jgi:tartrate-resistant acid phosphatase type 5
MDRIQSWAAESYKGAMRDLALSKADFKIINTHYSPHYHMSRPLAKKWFNITKAPRGVHAWFNGHTHGFNHDVTTWHTHFFQNGAGGGIVSQSGAQADPNAPKLHPEIDT